MLNKHERFVLGEIVQKILEFDKRTDQDQHTDTGQAWELFDEIRNTIIDLLERKR